MRNFSNVGQKSGEYFHSKCPVIDREKTRFLAIFLGKFTFIKALFCPVTVPLKCKLPPLVSFLARHVSFLSRRVSFLARVTEPFSMEYITREKSYFLLLYQRFLFAVRS